MAVLAFFTSYAQNNFPSNGQVTIGTATASPGSALDVNGRVMIDSCLTVKDSLVVESRIRAKDKLVVDDKAVFKDDATVKLNLRVNGNSRIDNNLRVDGTSKLNGDVKMENLGNYNGALDATELLIVKDNGQVKKVLLNDLYQYFGVLTNSFACLGDVNGDILNPQWASAINRVFIECPQVNVGIGTANPNYRLQVLDLAHLSKLKLGTGNPNSPENALINAYISSGSTPLVNLGNQIPGQNTYEERFTISDKGEVVITNVGSQASLTINNSNEHALIINDNNNQKIFQIENNGLTRAREIRVDAAHWADYVFDEDYELATLKEVDEFINKNHRLPGMPSEKQILEEGINVAGMQTLHMQKIEELTLYMIQMDERMNQMEQKIAVLEQENQKLKSTK